MTSSFTPYFDLSLNSLSFPCSSSHDFTSSTPLSVPFFLPYLFHALTSLISSLPHSFPAPLSHPYSSHVHSSITSPFPHPFPVPPSHPQLANFLFLFFLVCSCWFCHIFIISPYLLLFPSISHSALSFITYCYFWCSPFFTSYLPLPISL